MNKYLFIDDNNGHELDYIPFETNANLTQNMANQLMLEECPHARRVGSRIQHLEAGLNKKGYICHAIEYPDGDMALVIIRCVSGNY